MRNHFNELRWKIIRANDYDYRKDSYDKNTSSKYNYDCFGRDNRSHKDYNDHVIKYQYWNDY